MIQKVFFVAILVFHLVQSSYTLPLAQQDDPMKSTLAVPIMPPIPPMMSMPGQLPFENRQEQPMMPMSGPMPNQQDQNQPMAIHNDPIMMMALRNPSHPSNEPTHESVHGVKKEHQHGAQPVHEYNNDHAKEMQMSGNWRDQHHNRDHMQHAHMIHNHQMHNMMGPKDEHKPERSWSRAPNYPDGHASNIPKHHEEMQKHLAEQSHEHVVEHKHPSKARSEEFSNQLVGMMHQARQAYQLGSQPQPQPQPQPEPPCSRLVLGCSPTIHEVPCSHGSAPASYQPAPYPAAPPPPSYYASAAAPQYPSVPSYSPIAPSYLDVHKQAGPPYADALLGAKIEHPEHKISNAQHKDSHPEATNVKTHSKHNEPEKDIKNATEKETEKMTITTTTKAPIDHAVSDLKKKIQDHTVAMAKFREATEEKLRASLMNSSEAREHKHQHDSCIQACDKKLLESQQMMQKNLLQ